MLLALFGKPNPLAPFPPLPSLPLYGREKEKLLFWEGGV